MTATHKLDSVRLDSIRGDFRDHYLSSETEVVRKLADDLTLSADERAAISAQAASLVQSVRDNSDPNLMENFLTEYGLSTKEGVALMCLAEAMLRVPDSYSIDALIADKVSPADWGKHLGRSSSSMVNASTWALMLTGKVLDDEDENSLAQSLLSIVRRVGEPVIRTAVGQAMKELGQNFVLGRTIEEAKDEATELEGKGYAYSYDMLGEAARTDRDAKGYHIAYSDAITALASACRFDGIRQNPGISVKLSALHPRYEWGQRETVMAEVVGRARSLALLAKSANMGFNIDAEEADRLDLSLDVIAAILSDPALKNWDGFGVVVQAYGKRATYVLDWLYELSVQLDRKIMVRLVKGAYWDTEIKRAQVLGLGGFPVFTRKENTDLSYMACAQKLLRMTDRIYPQFATHNAHTVAAILAMADDKEAFEFQRLHGMGEALHDQVLKESGTLCRIYAPVGSHQDLLAYLVRRLLENGANSSFVNQLVDEDIAPELIAADPVEKALKHGAKVRNAMIPLPKDIFPGRINSRGWDITDPATLNALDLERNRFSEAQWHWGKGGTVVYNPANANDVVGTVKLVGADDVAPAIEKALVAFGPWNDLAAERRAQALEKAADLYEENAPELMAIACREAGKTLLDAVGEIREAVDFLRYYATEARRLDAENPGEGRGVFACISPWNFPLAIFTGQLSAALAAGNAVIAKPAESTVLIANRAVELLHEAGVPKDVLQLLPGLGSDAGATLSADPRIAGLCFTGSTATAQLINRTMAKTASPEAPLIAETGGINAMIVDSTALPEQAVRDVLASAFQSAGQRCSALRLLYVQDDVAERTLKMLFGAMDALQIGDPWQLSTDVGPVIDECARKSISDYIELNRSKVIKQLELPADCQSGTFVPPTVVQIDGMKDLDREVFGPVLHVAIFEPEKLDQVIEEVNSLGYGLTFGLHTRIDQRVQTVVDTIDAGNIYVNRNQIGAVVGSQPFGGEGLSGTGPKAGGPLYVERFRKPGNENIRHPETNAAVSSRSTVVLECKKNTLKDWRKLTLAKRLELLSAAGLPAPETIDLTVSELPGPTGESNRLEFHPRGTVVCLGSLGCADRAEVSIRQAALAMAVGNQVICVAPGLENLLDKKTAQKLPWTVIDQVDADNVLSSASCVAACGNSGDLKVLRESLADLDGPLVLLVTELNDPMRFVLERSICVDTTAAGGNASLLAAVAD